MFELTAGFMPLTDSAVLLAAREMGFAEDEGIDLRLVRESSWANMRDRLAIGHFEIAHALAPMPIAANLGLTPFDSPLIAPMALGLGGNAITVSIAVSDEMRDGREPDITDARSAGLALRRFVERRHASGERPLKFGVVHPHSVHNYELRYWLSGSGINPETDVEIVVLPPPLMADTLSAAQIDGYCVGEPWNTVAVSRGVGRIATVKSAIWASSPEKVLAMRADWAEANGALVAGLLRALHRSSVWCGDPGNVGALAALLARREYLDQKVAVIEPALSSAILGNARLGPGLRFFEPLAGAATFPWQSHALWLYTQMVRAGHVAHRPANIEVARSSFRPDIYRAALAPLGVAVPSANSKVEGGLSQTTAVGVTSQSLFLGPDGFFDGRVFDPDRIDAYLDDE
jgi:ABC-type nitrate/sulfonate/bicarbonate transport system substrate-binding protein